VADLAVHPERQDGRCLMHVSGELDLATVDILRSAAEEQMTGGGLGELEMDLAELTFLDSSGLGALLQIRSDAMARGATFRISAVAPGVARVIEIAGLTSTFGIDRP
jgi:anti-anti-sigma factor